MSPFQILTKILIFFRTFPKYLSYSRLPKFFVKVLTKVESSLVIESQHVWYF